MSPRRRSKAKLGWPANLYERGGYFTWRDPRTRLEYGLGKDRASAMSQAVEANMHLTQLSVSARLVQRIAQVETSTHTLAAWNTKFQAMLKANGRAENSLRGAKSLGARMVRMLGDVPLDSITSLEVSNVLEAVVGEGKARLAQALRGFMRDAFREARVAGWLKDENPVLDTRLKIRVKVRRSRLTLEQFRAIYEKVTEPWLRNAVDLAIITAQRRDDIAHAQFKDFSKDRWWLVQRKTGAQIALPLSLRLDVVGKSLGDVVAQCRRTGVLSKHLVHQTERRGNSPPGQQIWVDTISRRFADAVTAAGIDWGDKSPATFHELRSLSARLYRAQGGIDVQELLGHKTSGMTEQYEDSRGATFIQVAFRGE